MSESDLTREKNLEAANCIFEEIKESLEGADKLILDHEMIYWCLKEDNAKLLTFFQNEVIFVFKNDPDYLYLIETGSRFNELRLMTKPVCSDPTLCWEVRRDLTGTYPKEIEKKED